MQPQLAIQTQNGVAFMVYKVGLVSELVQSVVPTIELLLPQRKQQLGKKMVTHGQEALLGRVQQPQSPVALLPIVYGTIEYYPKPLGELPKNCEPDSLRPTDLPPIEYETIKDYHKPC